MICIFTYGASQEAHWVKNLPRMRETQETWVQSLVWEDPLEEGMQPIPAFLPGESSWTEEPGRLQSVGLQRVRQAPLSIGILPARILEWVACPPPGDLPNPGTEPISLVSPLHWQADS